MWATLKHNDLCSRVETSCSGCYRSAACHASYNQNLLFIGKSLLNWPVLQIMRCVWCQHFTTILCNQHHILNVETIYTVNVARYFHCQYHSCLQRSCLGSVDVRCLCCCRSHTDGVSLMTSPDSRGTSLLHSHMQCDTIH